MAGGELISFGGFRVGFDVTSMSMADRFAADRVFFNISSGATRRALCPAPGVLARLVRAGPG